MRNKIVILDLICFVLFPLVIWNYSRNYIGDYYAMLISSIPGLLYSIYRFVLIKKVHIFGIYMIANLAIGTIIDVISASAIQMLWNHVIFSYISAVFFIVTVAFHKPIVLFFSLDFVEMQGYDRKIMKEKFYQKRILFIFMVVTLGFAFKDILLASIKVGLILEYGVEAFDKGIIIRKIMNWGISAILFLGIIHISKLLKEQSNSSSSVV